MGNPIMAGALLTQGLRAELQDVWAPSYKGVAERMSPFVYTLPSDKIKEVYGWLESPIYPVRWDRGNMIGSKNLKSAQMSIVNQDWGRRIYWHSNDEADAQVGNLVAAARNLGANWATLVERVFFQMLNAGTDNDLLLAVPNAQDGSALYLSGTRYGSSSGNIVTLTGVTTAQQVITDVNSVEQRFGDFQDTEGQPLWDPSQIAKGFSIFYGTAQTLVFKQAFKQHTQALAASTATSNAGISNVILDSGDNFTLTRTQRITATQYFVFLNGLPDAKKPIVHTLREGISEANGNWEISDHTRDTGEKYVQFKTREGFGIPVPFGTIKVV